MKLMELNSGIIFTNEKCIGCSKCISGCIAVGANVVLKEADSNQCTVVVDPNRCVLCGHCVEECVHQARTYRDDTDAFFDALARGERISILVAPSLLIDFEKQYNGILGYLKHLGVNHIYSTSFGADIMVWVYMNFIQNFGLSGVISQFCPVIVNYLEKYRPELIEYLMPVQSPMMSTAIYVSDYLKIDDKLACISSCIAEKYEIDDVNTYGRVSYNVTFRRLMERLADVDLSAYYAEDEVSYGLGALVSSAGGLSSNIGPYVGFDKVLIQTSGYSNIFPYFDHYAKEFEAGGRLPFLVDVLSCTNGCNFGTGTCCGVEQRNEVSFSAHRVREKAYASGSVPTVLDYAERLNILNNRFAAFELTSFVRQYDTINKVCYPVLSDDEMNNIFLSMYKETYEQRHTDCGACGNRTCFNMAYAIGMHTNLKENCINYSKQRIQEEKEKTAMLLKEISNMNEELKQSAQLKSNFLANMSHEIRTPMNAVIGMAEMALRGALPHEERGYIQQIKSSGRSLLAIINDILDFSKIESGKMELNETDYAVMSLINDTVNIVMTRIGEKNITLVVDADPDLPFTLHGDDIRLKQVIVNYANNAVKFTESGFVEITMRYERSGTGVLLTVVVKDSGIGIKQEDLHKLFSSFQQVDSKRNRNLEGTGLGLAISREFINLMHGEIHVDSVYGEGSAFSFTVFQEIVEDVPSVSLVSKQTVKTASLIENLFVRDGFRRAIAKLDVENTPCVSVQELVCAVDGGAEFVFIDYPLWNEEADAFVKTHGQVQTVVIVDPRKDIVDMPYVRRLNQPLYSLSVAAVLNHEVGGVYESHSHAVEFRFEAPDAQVLIVDDNAINLTVAKGLLLPLRMNITTASSGREAVKLIESNFYDIVLMDHMMPDMDGVEATHIIRNKTDAYFKNLPIIALTANAINNARDMFLREGMTDFVAKPIEMADISARIKKWLPPEKVLSIGKKEDEPAPKVVQDLPKIEGLDVAAGVSLSGNFALYRKILGDYHAVIHKKADLIERYAAQADIKGYTIEVHALKSTSRLIGALELGELAAGLEQCGHAGDLARIQSETPALLQSYRRYIDLLAPYAKATRAPAKDPVTTEHLCELVVATHAALDDFDIDGAATIVEELQGYLLDEQSAALLEQLTEAVDEVEYDGALEITTAWKILLGIADDA